MKASHQDYARARERLLAAQAEMAEASAEMEQASGAVRAELDRAWDANQKAVADAHAALTEARSQQAEIETEVGNAARKRHQATGGVGLIILTDEEQTRVSDANAAVEAANADALEARDRFKAGVTAEQLAQKAD